MRLDNDMLLCSILHKNVYMNEITRQKANIHKCQEYAITLLTKEVFWEL